VHPGASWSVADVWRGVHDALQQAGAEVIEYNLCGRIEFAGQWLRLASKRNPGKPKPTAADTLYLACQGILERALRLNVDWVLIVSGTYIHPEALSLLRKAHVKTACILTETPYADEQEHFLAGLVDVVFTNERAAVPGFQAINPRTYYWQHAMDPHRHNEHGDTEEPVAAHDVVFVGTGFEERVAWLRAMDWDGIDLGLYGGWDILGSRNPLRRYVRGEIIDNKLTAALYRQARVGINLHRTSVGFGRGVAHITNAESMNPRCYELAACGRCFVTDWRAEVDDVFGDLPIVARTPAEMERLIRHYLAHEDERIRIGEQLPALVAGHTFDARIAQVLKVLEGT